MNEVNQNVVKFLEKVATDEELQAKMQKATNQDEAYAIASAVQDGFTKQEFVEVMQALNTQTANELSEDDLNKVAGGRINLPANLTKDLRPPKVSTDFLRESAHLKTAMAKSAAM